MTSNSKTPARNDETEPTLVQQVEETFGNAQNRAGDAYKKTRDTIRHSPVTSTAIVTGTLAAIGGAIYGATRWGKRSRRKAKPPHVTPSAT
ncbi:hypothetical protein [Stakelama saccharophila]|uniref:DUF3618 domain-containing protein n=1 Tax=Stakelama saccharophila TaxID=3075605 RepID=A0ABZ0B5T5_9SPHN|nr:hypothetical protein [Stakelama sp. W311]WNO52738.1 hypothetical protein RPR59_09705 [Stakelama sp. W311]